MTMSEVLTPGRRRVLAWVCLGLALLLLLVGSLTVWVKRQALDTDNWVDVSSQLLEDEEVRAVASTVMVDALFSGPNLEQRVEALLPEDLKGLAGPAVGLLREAAVPAADRLLADPRTQELWREANRRAHEQLIAVLDGVDDGVLTTSGGDVVLNLQPLVERLGARVGLQPVLEDGAGTVVILSSDRLEGAQDAVRAIRTMSVLVLIGVLVLIVLAVWLAEGFRRQMLLVLGAGVTIIGGILLVVRRVAGDILVDALTDPTTRDAGQAVWLIGTGLLHDLALALLTYGIILLIGAWLAGPSAWAVAVRRRLAPVMRDRVWWVYGVVAVLFLAALAWGPVSGDRRLLGVLVLAALVVAGVEVLRRQIVRESAAEAAPSPRA
ncbi:MAG: hypothetical protein AB7V62_06535 [Thermoleophilia bacterium]